MYLLDMVKILYNVEPKLDIHSTAILYISKILKIKMKRTRMK